jgi:hypothetical protein
MINIFVKRIFLLGLLFLFPGSVLAEAPSGHYQNQFTVQPGLWDISGTYIEGAFATPENPDVVSQGTMLVLVQDDKGKITGNGLTSLKGSGLDLEMTASIKGAIKSLGNITRASLKINFVGTLALAMSSGTLVRSATSNLQLDLEINPASRQLVGTYKTKLCVKGAGGGCESASGSQQYDLPDDMDGTWDLGTDIQNTNNKLTGSASATLSNGRTLPLSLKGQYASKNDLTNLNLKGSAGTVTIQANGVPGALVLQKMTANLLGQMVTAP